MKHILEIHKNTALITTKILETDSFCNAFITSKISESNIIQLNYKSKLYLKSFFLINYWGVKNF